MTETNGLTPPPGRRGGHGHLLGLFLALAVSGLCLYLFLRGTNWPEVWGAIAHARPAWLGLAFLGMWASVVFRAYRWRRLMVEVKPDVGIPRLYNMTMIGLMANGIFPARLGEIARPLLLAGRERLPFLGVLATIVAERILDLVMVAVILVTSLNLFTFPPGQTIALPGLAEPIAVDTALVQAGTWLGVFLAAMIAAAAALLFLPAAATWLTRATLGRLSPRLASTALAWLDSFRRGLGSFRSPARAVPALVWSLAVWIGILVSAWCLFPAFSLAIGPLGAMLLTAGIAVCVALPQAPGYLGVFHLAVTLILVKCFAVDESVAKASAIVLWLIQLVGSVLLGFVSLALEGLALGEIWRSREAHAETAPSGRRVAAGGRSTERRDPERAGLSSPRSPERATGYRPRRTATPPPR